jgi:hypothetical protein
MISPGLGELHPIEKAAITLSGNDSALNRKTNRTVITNPPNKVSHHNSSSAQTQSSQSTDSNNKRLLSDANLQMSTYLTSLPAELLLQILRYLSSPRDLDSSIRAFAPFYRIFVSFRDSIQSSILLRAIHPAAQADALFALDVRQIIELLESGEKISSLEQRCCSLLESYTCGQDRDIRKAISDRSRVRDLFSLYSAVENFMIDYCNNALYQLNPTCATEDNGNNLEPRLSWTELGRLQRAFFHFEIYVRLFHVSQPRGRLGCMSGTKPAQRFISGLTPWEAEGIACVTQYLTILVGKFFDKVEDDFVTLVSEKAEAHNSQNPMSPASSSPDASKSEMVGLEMLEWFGLHFFEETNKPRHKDHIDFLVSRGLLFVHKLSRLESRLLMSAILSTDLQSRPNTRLWEALWRSDLGSWTVKYGGCGDSKSGVSTQNSDDSLKERSPGWQWAFGDGFFISIYKPDNFDLRNQGYVFWDRSRLEGVHTFRSPRARKDTISRRSPSYQPRSNLPSAEEKLRHLEVHWKVIREISDEIEAHFETETEGAYLWQLPAYQVLSFLENYTPR